MTLTCCIHICDRVSSEAPSVPKARQTCCSLISSVLKTTFGNSLHPAVWTVRGHRAHRGTDFKKSTWVWEGWPGYSTSSSSSSCGWSWSSCRTPPSCCQDGNTTCEQSGGKVQDRSSDIILFIPGLYFGWVFVFSLLMFVWECSPTAVSL